MIGKKGDLYERFMKAGMLNERQPSGIVKQFLAKHHRTIGVSY